MERTVTSLSELLGYEAVIWFTACIINVTVLQEDFNAHRVILSARSKVLKALLKDPKFKETGILQLDIDPTVLRMVLYYIYTGSLEGEHQTIMKYKDELLKTAQDLDMTGFIQVLNGFNEVEDLT